MGVAGISIRQPQHGMQCLCHGWPPTGIVATPGAFSTIRQSDTARWQHCTWRHPQLMYLPRVWRRTACPAAAETTSALRRGQWCDIVAILQQVIIC